MPGLGIPFLCVKHTLSQAVWPIWHENKSRRTFLVGQTCSLPYRLWGLRERELEILGFETILIIMIVLERFSYFVGSESLTFHIISRVIISINPLSHSLDITFIQISCLMSLGSYGIILSFISVFYIRKITYEARADSNLESFML